MAGFCSLLLVLLLTDAAVILGYLSACSLLPVCKAHVILRMTQIYISVSTVALGNTSTTESVPNRNNHIGKQPWMKNVIHRK